MKAKLNRNQKGFSIIEVLIVLAIAGLIMVVVFLAVPALQRNARNNALTTNANNIFTGVSNYLSNNNGVVPTAVATGTNQLTIGATGTNQEVVKTDSSIGTVTLNGASPTASSGVGTVQIVTGTGAKCNTAKTALAGGGSPRSVAVLYVAEGSGSTNIMKCID